MCIWSISLYNNKHVIYICTNRNMQIEHLVYNPMSYMRHELIRNKPRPYSVISYTNNHVIYMH